MAMWLLPSQKELHLRHPAPSPLVLAITGGSLFGTGRGVYGMGIPLTMNSYSATMEPVSNVTVIV